MNLDNLSKTEKENLKWFLDFLESRTERIEEVKKYYNMKNNVTTFLSIHEVTMLLTFIFSPPEELEKFRNSIEKILPLESGKEILFKGILTKFVE